MKITANEKKYWFNIVTPEAVESILKRRAENDQLSSAYDTAQAFNPSGKVPQYVKDRVSAILWNLYTKGQIKKIKQDVTSNPDSAQKKWHYKYSPTPRNDWLSLVANRHKRKTDIQRKRVFAINQLTYYKELIAYAKKHGTFKFIQAFRDITGLKQSSLKTNNKTAYSTYQRLYNTAKYLHRHGYLQKITGGRHISFRFVKEPVQTKPFPTPKTRVIPIEVTPMKIVRVEVEVLNSNLSDKTKISLLKKLMGDD